MAREEPQVNSESTRPTLEEVLDEYVATVEQPDWEALQRWMRRFPQYASELSRFSAAWTFSEHLPVDTATAAIDDDRWRAIGREAMLRAVAENHAAYAPSVPASLTELMQEQGLSRPQLAREAGISLALLRKLELRLIGTARLRPELVGVLADRLRTSAQALTAYFQQPPALASGAQYRAEQAPAVGRVEEFDEAVRKDLSLSKAQKERLLTMALPSETEGHE